MRYTPTPTSSNTPTPSLTATITPSNTASSTPCPPSATATPTPTITPTVTPGLTPTMTPTSTKTPTPTPTITPTKTSTPTPTPTPVCVCTSYTISNNGLEGTVSVSWTDCDNNPQSQILNPETGISICACEGTVSVIGFNYTIDDLGPCSTECICNSFTVMNLSPIASMEVYWTTCDGDPVGNLLPPEQGISFCACAGSVTTIGGDPDITEYGICEVPGITPSSTPTPTPTPTCPVKGWYINTCSHTCTGAICTCTFDGTFVVYTDCSVTDITDGGTLLYTDSGLTIPYIGFFSRSGYIWYSNAAVSIECALGGPC